MLFSISLNLNRRNNAEIVATCFEYTLWLWLCYIIYNFKKELAEEWADNRCRVMVRVSFVLKADLRSVTLSINPIGPKGLEKCNLFFEPTFRVKDCVLLYCWGLVLLEQLAWKFKVVSKKKTSLYHIYHIDMFVYWFCSVCLFSFILVFKRRN